MATVALLEFYTSRDYTLIFLVKQGFESPRIFQALRGEGRPLTREYLMECVERLLVDFHGLPADWDSGPRTERFRHLLTLPPAVNSAKRCQEVKRNTLMNPRFAYELTYWEQLADALFPPALKDELADCDLLCLIPHGPLHALPFSALRWSHDKYLVERFGLCSVPSAAILRHCQAKNRVRSSGGNHRPSQCLIAAVAAKDEVVDDFERDGELLASLLLERDPPGRVSLRVGAEPSSGRMPATKEHILRECQRYDIIHFACHGIFSIDGISRDPLDSALLLSDGATCLSLAEVRTLDVLQRAPFLLTAREIFSLKLTADLITLRACSSGRGELHTGDEMIGLTRAFLYAGAPSLIVSLWNVNKTSSRILLDEFYRRWLGECATPKWKALQQAQIAVMNNPDYRHPYHWAPFILMGDWC